MSVKLFSELFSGRKDAYGLNRICLKEPVTQDVYEKHISGEHRIGIYPINKDNKTKWLAIDIDDGDLEKAKSFKQRMKHFGISSYIERSKSKGYHVWTFFSEPVEAVKPRLIAEMVLKELDFKCEIFPKQDNISERNPYGNFIFLPLFGGDVKRDKTVFVNTSGNVIAKTTNSLSRISVVDIKKLDDIIEVNDLKREDMVYETSEAVEAARSAKGTLPCIEKIKLGGIAEGQGRNECAFRLVIHYKEKGITMDEVGPLLASWNSKNIDLLDKKEMYTIIDSVYKGKYKSFGCDSAIIQVFCDKENCSFISGKDRKEQIERGIITLVFRDSQSMVFRKKNYEYRLTNLEFARSGKFKTTFSLSRNNAIVYKDIISLDKASQRKKFSVAAKDKEIDMDIIKIEELVKKQMEKEEKEKLEKPKQLYVMTEVEKKEALKFLESKPYLLYEVIKSTNSMGVVGEEASRLMVYLCFTSRITKEPISITVKGESSSGKSFSCQCIKKLIPEEGYHFITRATQQAFFHLREDGMQHKIIYINELPGSESADYAIRTAQSEGDLILMLPVKDPITGDMETKEKRVKGPCGFLVTTTKASMFDENETRNFSIFTDDSPALTRRIGDITARKALGENFIVSPERINLFKNVQRLLNPELKIIIPFAREVFNAFPDKPVRIRRDRERFRELIEIVTLIHQFHRNQIKRDGMVILEATLADYYMACVIAGSTLLHTIYEIGPASKAIWEAVKEMEGKDAAQNLQLGPEAIPEEFTFKYKDIAEEIGWKPEKTKKWTLTLLSAGIIEYSDVVAGGRGRAAVYRISKTGKDIIKNAANFLPSVEDLWEDYPCDKNFFYNPITGAKINPEFADAPAELIM